VPRRGGQDARAPYMDRRIVIVGFMGSGKTTVAQALARQLGCRMIDLDSFIAEREGRSPAEIIAQDSEPAFRQIEADAMLEVLETKGIEVIALGGGAWASAVNRVLISQHNCVSVWLDAPFDLCWERITSNSKTIRPLAPDRESARSLYKLRRADYQLAQLRVEVSAKKEIAEIIAEIEGSIS
jgi:shikimate kinase